MHDLRVNAEGQDALILCNWPITRSPAAFLVDVVHMGALNPYDMQLTEMVFDMTLESKNQGQKHLILGGIKCKLNFPGIHELGCTF